MIKVITDDIDDFIAKMAKWGYKIVVIRKEDDIYICDTIKILT